MAKCFCGRGTQSSVASGRRGRGVLTPCDGFLESLVRFLQLSWRGAGTAAPGGVGPVSDPSELWEKAKRDSAARAEAFSSARNQAVARSRDEIREVYLTEFRSRDLQIPPADVEDGTVERIMGGPLSSARAMGEGLIETGKLLHGIFKIFRQISVLCSLAKAVCAAVHIA